MQGETGTVSAGGNVTITLSGSAAFTSATSYVCTANGDITSGSDIINVVNSSGTSFILYNDNNGFGGSNAAIWYQCIGH